MATSSASQSVKSDVGNERRKPLVMNYEINTGKLGEVLEELIWQPNVTKYELCSGPYYDQDYIAIHYEVTAQERKNILSKAAGHPAFLSGGCPEHVIVGKWIHRVFKRSDIAKKSNEMGKSA